MEETKKKARKQLHEEHDCTVIYEWIYSNGNIRRYVEFDDITVMQYKDRNIMAIYAFCLEQHLAIPYDYRLCIVTIVDNDIHSHEQIISHRYTSCEIDDWNIGD